MIATTERVTEGTMRTAEGQVLPLEGTRVQVRVVGPVAEVEVRQLFRNPTDRALEAVYLFPLPHEASVYRMEFRIRDRVVRAVVKEKEEARRTYEAARSQGRAATLLEQERPNLFTLSVANLPPGEVVEVTLGYHERVAYDEGAWRLVFPMVAAERYHEGPPRPEEAVARVRPPRPRVEDRQADIELEVRLEAGRPIEPPASPTHRLQVQGSGSTWNLHLHPSDRLPNRDFVLTWKAERPGVRPELWFHREPGRPGTFMLVLTPPAPASPKTPTPKGPGCTNCGAPLEDPEAIREVAGLGPAWRCGYCGAVVPTHLPAARKPLPRDLVVLVDRSASMRASTAGSTRAAVETLLEALAPEDAVQLMAFDHEVEAAGLDWLPAGEAALARARAYLQGLRPRGGTELERALEKAMELPLREGRTRIVVLLSDAAVGNEGRLLRRVPEILGGRARLYVLGLGAAPNRHLVAALARAGGGASDVLVPGEDPQEILPRFARRVREAGPVLKDLALLWDEAVPMDVYPSPVPDLFSGQPVHLVGRFTGEGPSRMVLTGTTAAGAPFRQEIDAILPERAEGPPGLERLWARLRIESLMERLARRPEQASDVRLEVLGLALKHKLVSAYTSLVAEDSEVTATPGREPERVEVQGLPLPDLASEPPTAPGVGAGALGMALGAPPPGPSMPVPAAGLASALPAPPRVAPASAEVSMALEAAPPSTPPSPARRARGGAAGAGLLGGLVGGLKGALEGAFHGAPTPESRRSPEPLPRPGAPTLEARSSREPLPRLGTPAAFQAPQGQVPLRPQGSETYSAQELAWARERTTGEIDLVFLVDETGSMGPYIEEVKRRLLELVEALKSSPLCRSLRLGLVTYRDHPPQDHTFVSRVVPLTGEIGEVRQGVERMQASGGGDGPEAVSDGLHDLLHLDWRPGAVRVVVWVGDAPPHGVEPAGDGFPGGCPCGRHWYVQAESCREMGISIHAVGCLPGLHQFAGAEEVFRMVARTSRGLYVPLAHASYLVPLIAGVADRELDRRRLEEHLAELVQEHRQVLQAAEEPERVRFLKEVLEAQGVRRLDLGPEPGSGPAPLRFRALTDEDVLGGLEELRRLERVEV